MKYIIKENQGNRLSSILQSKVNSLKIEGLCRVEISKMSIKNDILLSIDVYLNEKYVQELHDDNRPVRIHLDYIQYQIKQELKSYGNFKIKFNEYREKC